jgi:PiT family inorganic phosphate transporter
VCSARCSRSRCRPWSGALVGLLGVRALRRAARRATRRLRAPARAGEWAMSAGLALSRGANDAQKTVEVIGALLVADGQRAAMSSPTWAELACASVLTIGTALGGWRIVETVGRRIYRLHRVDGLASQTASACVIFGASLLGAPVSTTQVVASSVVGVGGGRRRWHHVRWTVVRDMGLASALTMPATAALAGLTVLVWRGIGRGIVIGSCRTLQTFSPCSASRSR